MNDTSLGALHTPWHSHNALQNDRKRLKGRWSRVINRVAWLLPSSQQCAACCLAQMLHNRYTCCCYYGRTEMDPATPQDATLHAMMRVSLMQWLACAGGMMSLMFKWKRPGARPNVLSSPSLIRLPGNFTRIFHGRSRYSNESWHWFR